MLKRIETATEIVTVDRNNVVHVVRKDQLGNLPRNFSFAALGKRAEETRKQAAIVAPVLFSLFANDYPIARGTFAEMYDEAWAFTCGALICNEAVIIC